MKNCTHEHMSFEMKPGNNLVIQFSTAAYDLSKICIHKLLHCNTFTYAAERQDGLDLSGANMDTCYKIFNKKADGMCGKILNFFINFYHTTSQILVNGNKTDIFISDILDKLGSELRTRCYQLDIININIATTFNKCDIQDKAPQNNQIQSNNENESNFNLSIDETESDNEVCEICPICQKPAYGKVVQCGECGEWHHYECINISNTTIEILGPDDFICTHCIDNLKYSTSEKDHEKTILLLEPEEKSSTNENYLTICDNLENLQAVRDQQKQEPQITLLNSTASSENRTTSRQNIENNTKDNQREQ